MGALLETEREVRAILRRAAPIPHNAWTNRPEYEAAALRVLRSGHVAQGPEVTAFEAELAARFRPGGAACVVSSGTAALRLALILLGRDDIWLPTYACAALWYAPIPGFAGHHLKPPPQLRDCEADTLNTPDATVVVHTYGLLADVGPQQVEDFTHAAGAPGAGSMGAYSVCSFGATKPLGIGAGGVLLGPEPAIRQARALRDYDTWPGEGPAFNFQLGDVYAAIGRERLRSLDEDNAWRLRTAQRYADALPDASGVRASLWGGWRRHGIVVVGIPYRFVLRMPCARVPIARQHFADRGIETINPLTTEELLHRRLRISSRHFPNAERAAHETLSVPIWPGMAEPQVERVVDALASLEPAA